jgi:hypothetical protein
MIWLLVIIGVAIVLAIATSYQSYHAHVKRYGHLPVVMRWFSGRQRHGLEGDDRRHDDRYDPLSKHYHPAERWSRGIQRTAFVFGMPLLALFYVTGSPKAAVYGFAFLAIVVLNQVGRMTIRGRLNWTHHGRKIWRNPSLIKQTRVAYVRKPSSSQVKPLHRKLAGIVGVPSTVSPGQWIRPVGSKGIEVVLPRNWNGSEADRNKIANTVKETMGMHADTVPQWRLGAGDTNSVVIMDQPPPPLHVTLKDIRVNIEKAGQDAVVLGIGRGGEPVAPSLKADSPHFGLSVGAGGGKSQMARLAASQILHNGGIVLILDIKRISHAWARDLPNVRYARTVEEIHEALVWLAFEIDRRTKVADVGMDVEGEVLANVGPRMLVVAEELNEVMARLRALWAETRTRQQPKKSPAIAALEGALFMGRQIRINMFAVAQMMTALAAGSGAARENMGVRILGRYTRNNWRMLVPEFDMPVRSMRPGRVQVVTSDVKECQIAFLSGAEARELALSGTITPWPADLPDAVKKEIEDHVRTVPGGISLSIDLEEKEITLPEAVTEGYTRKNIRALRNAKHRDPRFPKPVGRRLEQHGRPWTYNSHAIVRWDRDM